MFPLLSSIIFLPLAAALGILLTPRNNVRLIRTFALSATFVVLCLSVLLVIKFNSALPGVQFVEHHLWIAPMNAWYFLGVDGLNVAMVFLTALLGFLACIASGGIGHSQKEYFVLYLILMTGMLGTFLALDLFLFYIFWEAVLIPMYFLIGIWGGPRKEYAAMKFLLYTLAGSVIMLVGILVAYFSASPHTFNMFELAQVMPLFDLRLQIFLFLSFYIAFAIKVPVFPFHTWLPDAHVEAPTPISVLLAGVLLKMGCYGLFRICLPFFPDATQYFSLSLAVLGAINLIYGACVAMAQTDFKKMIAYSSVSHMGFVLLGFASLNITGFNGALLEMFNHGIITGAMFLLVGVLYDRAHTRELDQFGGLSATMPKYAFFLTFCTLGSLGLPGLSGFVGEFLSLIGAYPVFPKLTAISCLGLIITAGYFLFMIQKVLLGPVNPVAGKYPDMNKWETLTLVPLSVIIAVVGVYPAAVIKFQQIALEALLIFK
ncbi:MAG TPA: NADH-quinone oxidoreductase subunit M [Candidatus Omnitrophota bacterium]|nr:NADH-quinone oxidoreductase subunit M [Candidatus Omnitrophota bacterium]